MLSPSLQAVPLCSDIFTDPPTGSHNPNGLAPPSGLESSRGDFTCYTHGHTRSCNRSDSFAAGDFNFSDGSFSHGNYISTSGTTTRLYFDNLDLTQANINASGKPENLLIFVRGNVHISGQNYINAIVYVAGTATFSGQATIDGAMASGGSLSFSGNAYADVDLSIIDKADFGGMCTDASALVDHFEFQLSANPLTCKAETVTLKACANGDCSSLITDAVQANLLVSGSSSAYWVGGNSVSFSGGSTSLSLRSTTTESITLGIGSSTPSELNSTLCRLGALAPSVAACTLSFADSGLVFEVPDKLANKAAEGIKVMAVKKDDSSQSCAPAFVSTTKSLSLWSDYLDPNATTQASNAKVTVNNTAIGASQADATVQNLSFDGAGEATIQVNYPDAGQLQLNLSYSGSGEDAELSMSGSDTFVSFPVGLCVVPEDPGAVCAAGDASCPAYKQAGESFNLKLQAMAWESDNDSDYCNNPTTPNYAQANIVLGSELVAPSGGEPGTLTTQEYNHQMATAGLNIQSQAISEVGVFKFTAAPPATYLGSNFYSIPKASTGYVGRFIPARFELQDPSVLAACGTGNFSYLDQPFGLSLSLRALNTKDEVTQNYRGEFAKGMALLVLENNDDGKDLGDRIADLPSWDKGGVELPLDFTTSVARLPAPGVDGPFDAAMLGIKVADTDKVALTAADMNAATTGNCADTDDCDAIALSSQSYFHGRVVLDNTYGPEDQWLTMAGRVQYWNGSAWALNLSDSCSSFAPALATQVDDTVLGYGFNPALGVNQEVERFVAGPGTMTEAAAGNFNLLWRALTAGTLGGYTGQVTAPLEVPLWLQWYWNWNGLDANALSNPRASAYFGRYRGHDKVIYWREVY
ncbi:DUF6701 domain-containing protein [Shewanella sedimentimangrovi]|uniref:DUF6701 domain-containing protein n=1 Tax=Shewanella sedimentimangrovi TaxID=2814293 RepID=A0ABX7R0W5_9GAMM|nr:DUF6701 domain-containing protein [Shewanella sedimentimangrovi]QSX36850.1 hypothetical protein JYB85_16505 [Shewanella sedimentimangrovi]